MVQAVPVFGSDGSSKTSGERVSRVESSISILIPFLKSGRKNSLNIKFLGRIFLGHEGPRRRDILDKNFMQVAFSSCFRQGVAGMSRDLGRDVPDLEKLYARKLWADFRSLSKIFLAVPVLPSLPGEKNGSHGSGFQFWFSSWAILSLTGKKKAHKHKLFWSGCPWDDPGFVQDPGTTWVTNPGCLLLTQCKTHQFVGLSQGQRDKSGSKGN